MAAAKDALNSAGILPEFADKLSAFSSVSIHSLHSHTRFLGRARVDTWAYESDFTVCFRVVQFSTRSNLKAAVREMESANFKQTS